MFGPHMHAEAAEARRTAVANITEDDVDHIFTVLDNATVTAIFVGLPLIAIFL